MKDCALSRRKSRGEGGGRSGEECGLMDRPTVFCVSASCWWQWVGLRSSPGRKQAGL